jgi:hypothetical protein
MSGAKANAVQTLHEIRGSLANAPALGLRRVHRRFSSGANGRGFWIAAEIPQSGSHVALEVLSAIEKRCRRCALPPQSKFLVTATPRCVLLRLDAFRVFRGLNGKICGSICQRLPSDQV